MGWVSVLRDPGCSQAALFWPIASLPCTVMKCTLGEVAGTAVDTVDIPLLEAHGSLGAAIVP